MFSRRMSKCLPFGLSLILLGVGLTKCHGQNEVEPPEQQPVTSLIQISMQPGSLVYKDNVQSSLEEFKIYKNTQAQLVKAPYILTAALRKPEIASLGIYQEHKDHPITWLQQNLKVTFPGDGEIMKISFHDSNRQEAVKMLRAVVHAYLSEYVETERNIKARELAAIEELLAQKERMIRQRRTALKALAEDLGTVDPRMLKIQSQFTLRQFTLHQQELFRMKAELRKLQADRAVMQAALKRLEKQRAPKASNKDSNPELQHAFRRAELREKIADTDVRIELASEDVAEAKCEVEELEEKYLRISRTSVELEMMQADLRNLEKVVRDIAAKREAFGVENSSRPRIRLLQRAEMSQ